MVVWDLAKAYNSIHTTADEMHARRLVWRWGEFGTEWEIYSFVRMAFGDRPAAAGLEVGKVMVAEAGNKICPTTAKMMIKGSYVDDASGGGTKEDVKKLMGEAREVDGEHTYDGTVAKIFALGGMRVKVMVPSGETCPKVIAK